MLELPIRRDDCAYRDTWLWVPKSKVNARMLRHSLTLSINGGQDTLVMYREAEHHIGIPRERLDLDELKYEVVDLTPQSYEEINIESRIVLDAQDPTDTIQRDSFIALLDSTNGILNLRCGAGKTVVLLHFIAELGVPALIVNDKANILKQWEQEIGTHLEVPGKLGWVQGRPSKWRWETNPITLASLKTLSLYHDEIPAAFCQRFGIVVWDECHHLAARQYALTADMFPGRRYGATATINRPDGLEVQYLWHIGPVVHRNLKHDLIPEVTFVASPTTVDWDCAEQQAEYTDKFGTLHIQKLCAFVGQLPGELEFAQEIIDREIANNRDILALSVSKDHSRALHTRYPGSGVLDGDVHFSKRLAVLAEHKLTFATVQLAREALDKKSLDVLILLTEFSSDNNLQQAIGRVLRKCVGKAPKVIILSHEKIAPMRHMGMKLRNHFRKWGMKVKDG